MIGKEHQNPSNTADASYLRNRNGSNCVSMRSVDDVLTWLTSIGQEDLKYQFINVGIDG